MKKHLKKIGLNRSNTGVNYAKKKYSSFRYQIYFIISHCNKYIKLLGMNKIQTGKKDQFLYIFSKNKLKRFNSKLYLDLNPDVKACRIDPCWHFINFGINENRSFDKQTIELNYEIQHSLENFIKPKIGLFLEKLDDGTISPCSKIRIELPLSYLAALNEIAVEYFDIKLINNYNIIYMNRLCATNDQLISILDQKSNETKIIYDLDDNLFALDHNTSENIEAALLAAHARIVSTKELGAIIENKTMIRCDKIGNFPISENHYAVKNSDDKLKILYFGTLTHDNDWLMIEPIFRKIVHENKDVEIYVMGVVTNTEILPKYVKLINIDGLHRYEKFVKKFAEIGLFDIGIVPLVNNELNRSKSAIKFYDYLLNCEYVIASSVGEYSEIIHPRLIKIDSQNLNSWVKEINKILANKTKLDRKFNYPSRKLNSLSSHLSIISKVYNDNLILSPMKIDRLPSKIARNILASKYFYGDGIEIGALHNPLEVPKRVSVKYLDRMSVSDLYKHYPELQDLKLVSVDIIDNGERLYCISDSALSFIIANHMLEHCENPIGTLQNFEKKLIDGGILYLAIPNGDYTFDKGRVKTSYEHLLKDLNDSGNNSRLQHFEEWVRICEKNIGYNHSEKDIDKRVEYLDNMNYSIHYHVWDGDTIISHIKKMKEDNLISLTIIDGAICKDETILIMRK